MMRREKSTDHPDMLRKILTEIKSVRADMQDMDVRLIKRIRGLEKAMQLHRRAIIDLIGTKLPDDP